MDFGFQLWVHSNVHVQEESSVIGGAEPFRFVPEVLLNIVCDYPVGLAFLKGLKTFSPGRRKSLSFPVTIVSPCRRAVAAM